LPLSDVLSAAGLNLATEEAHLGKTIYRLFIATT